MNIYERMIGDKVYLDGEKGTYNLKDVVDEIAILTTTDNPDKEMQAFCCDIIFEFELEYRVEYI